jgi:hypothetical protein
VQFSTSGYFEPNSLQSTTRNNIQLIMMNSYTLSLEELKLALILAHASAFTYHIERDNLKGELKNKLENKTDIYFKESFSLANRKSSTTWGFLGYYQDYMLIAFRGTFYKEDWMTNFQFWQREDIYTPVEKDNFVGKVHNGFAQLSDNIWYELQPLVEKYSNKSSQLLLTGHSLGGALAVLTSNRLISSRLIRSTQIQGVYTYGAPRVGDRNFKNAYNLNNLTHYRFEYNNDPVPHVPPPKLFEHTGKIRYLPKVLQNGNQVDILCEEPKFRVAPIYGSIAKSGVGVARVVQGIMSGFKNRDLNKGIDYIRQGIDIVSKSEVGTAKKEHDIQNYINHIANYWEDEYSFDYLEEQLRKL